MKWSTKAGSLLKPKDRVKFKFTLASLHENSDISCNTHVDKSHQASFNYDINIGRDLMHSMSINY
jgi:hypothetical protein